MTETEKQKSWIETFEPLRNKKDLEGRALIVDPAKPPVPASRNGLSELSVTMSDPKNPKFIPLKVRVWVTTRDLTDIVDLMPAPFTFVPSKDGKWSNVGKYEA